MTIFQQTCFSTSYQQEQQIGYARSRNKQDIKVVNVRGVALVKVAFRDRQKDCHENARSEKSTEE